MVEIGGAYKAEKQEEILIDKYYFYVKVIHKVVLDIYSVVVLVKDVQLKVFYEHVIIGKYRLR